MVGEAVQQFKGEEPEEEVEVKVEDGEATLSGAVADQAQQNRAQEVAEDISGVRNVRNALRVRQHGVGTTGNATSHDGRA